MPTPQGFSKTEITQFERDGFLIVRQLAYAGRGDRLTDKRFFMQRRFHRPNTTNAKRASQRRRPDQRHDISHTPALPQCAIFFELMIP